MPRFIPALVMFLTAGTVGAQSWLREEPPKVDPPREEEPAEPPAPACAGRELAVVQDQKTRDGRPMTDLIARSAVLLDEVAILGGREDRKVMLYPLAKRVGKAGMQYPDRVQPLPGSRHLRRVELGGEQLLMDGNLFLHRYRRGVLVRVRDKGPRRPIRWEAITRVPGEPGRWVAASRDRLFLVDLEHQEVLQEIRVSFHISALAFGGGDLFVAEMIRLSSGTGVSTVFHSFPTHRGGDGQLLALGEEPSGKSQAFPGWVPHIESVGGVALAGMETRKPLLGKPPGYSRGEIWRLDRSESGAVTVEALTSVPVRMMRGEGDRLLAGGDVYRLAEGELELVYSSGAGGHPDGFPYLPDLRGDRILAVLNSYGETMINGRLICIREGAVPEWR